MRYSAHNKRIPDWLCLMAILEEFAEEYHNPRRITPRRTDDIPIRDGWRCTAPGCTARELEIHHIVYQSRGGTNEPENLTSLCPFHHRMGERGLLAKVTGQAPVRLNWRLGREEVVVHYRNERRHAPRQIRVTGSPQHANVS